MNMKIGFLTAVGISAVILIVVAVVLIVLARSGVLLAEVGISLGNLLLDVFVGVFTIWGLYWAASEFAGAQVKPDLRLVIGRESADQQGIDPLTNEADALIGRNISTDGGPVSRVIVGLFLENQRPKAARYVRVQLYVRDVPCFKEFAPIRRSLQYEARDNIIRGEAVLLQFCDDLVIYRGAGAYLGNVRVDWPQGVHPERMTLVARLFSLEGEPKEVTISHPIHWV